RPGIVDAEVHPILDREEVYSGCYANVTVELYVFNVNGNRGVACGLGNIQKLRDGERLGGGGVKAESEFAVVDDDAADFLS
ncbi:MAG: Phage-associated protein, partial [Actinomyces urogenitalis DORA_12]